MCAVRVGAITIGQSPRDDVVPELLETLGGRVEVIQVGALDGLSLKTIKENSPTAEEGTLISRLRDGSQVEIAHEFVGPRLQDGIRSLEASVAFIVLLCTDPFDDLDSRVPLLRPAQLLRDEISAVRVRRLGVITPSAIQIPKQLERWRPYVPAVVVTAASPYHHLRGLEDAAAELIHNEVEFVLMDCIGYSRVLKAAVQSMMAVPVVSALDVLGRAAARMLDN